MLVAVGEDGWKGELTFAAEDYGEVPELRHVEGFENLALVACTVAVQAKSDVVPAFVLIGEGNAGAQWDLSAHDAIPAVEMRSEHVHASTLPESNASFSSEQFSDDGPNGATAHVGETVTPVGGDDVVLLGDAVFNAYCDGFLAG